MRRITTLLVLFLLFLGQISAQYETKINSLDTYFEKSVKNWNVPGVAIGIVKDGKVIFAKGYGVQEIGKKDKVDENTIFGIASNTKAFTSAALSILVEEKKIDWDQKLVEVMPNIKLYNDYVTQNITIRDLLSHRAGYKTFSGDLLWVATKYNRKEIIERLEYLQPTYPFRYKFGYSNLMFLVAGEIIPQVTDKSYDEFLKENIFQPLGMDNTVTSISGFDKIDNLAKPHIEIDGKQQAIEYISWDNIAPAGGINSNVTDMTKWITMLLNKGEFNETQIINKDELEVLWTPETPQSIGYYDKTFFKSKHFHSYGMGWDLFDYKGVKVINHAGGLDGMISQVAIIPELDLGFVILTNSINYLGDALMYSIIDEFTDGVTADYAGTYRTQYMAYMDYMKNKSEKEENARTKDTKPSLDLSKYVGTYSGKLYGDATISLKNGELFIVLEPAPQFNSKLSHWGNDVFSIKFEEFISLPKGTVSFILNDKKEITELIVDLPNPDFDFTELKFYKK